MEELESLSQQIKAAKEKVYNNFSTVLDMKSEVIGIPKDNQRSHTFTTSDSRCRIILGVHTVDGYRDTVEDGITMVKNYIESLAKDETTKALVAAVLRLLSRDATGQIKASRVLQLRKMRMKWVTRNSEKVYASRKRVTNPQYQTVHQEPRKKDDNGSLAKHSIERDGSVRS